MESDTTAITPEVARYSAFNAIADCDEERVNELSAKARSGTLTTGEEKLDSYLHIGRLLAMMQSRGRRL